MKVEGYIGIISIQVGHHLAFSDLLLSPALKVLRIGLQLFHAFVSLLLFDIPLSPQQAHACVFDLLLRILS